MKTKLLSLLIFFFLSVLNIFAGDTSLRESNTSPTVLNKYDISNIKARNAVMALNHMHASLNKIIIYNDKIVLEDEYNNIINNLNLTTIDDREIINITTGLMDTLTAFKLSEMEKEQFQREYEEKLDAALTDALSNISVNGMNPIQMASSLVISAGSAYMSYQSSQTAAKRGLDKSKWKLKKESIKELNYIRKDFLVTYWEIMKRYNMPDKWRITESQFTRFVNILKDADLKKKQRQLLRMEKEMEVFPTYWYELSVIAHHNKDKKIELKALKNYEKLNDNLLRHNSHYSLMLANKCSYYDYKTQKQEIIKLLNKILEVDPLNPERKLFAAMNFQLIGNTKKAETLLNENIDDNFLTVLSQRLKLSIYLEGSQEKAYQETINQLLQQQNLSAGNYLFYLGEKPLPSLVVEIEKQIKMIQLEIKTSIYGNNHLTVVLPKQWVYKNIENTEVLLTIGGNTYKPSKIARADENIIYTYDKVINKRAILNKSIDSLELSLVDNNLPIRILYNIALSTPHIDKVEEKKDEDSLLSKTANYITSKSNKVYNDYTAEIIFEANSIFARNKCFDIKNSLKECK